MNNLFYINILDMDNNKVKVYHDKEENKFFNDDIYIMCLRYEIRISDIQKMFNKELEVNCFSTGRIVVKYEENNPESKLSAFFKIQVCLLTLIMRCKILESKGVIK